MAKQKVNVIVPCTDRKTAEVEELAYIRQVTSRNLESRVEEWFNHLTQVKNGKRAAIKMYSGSAWTPVLGISKWPDINIWIISAGYGLLHHSDEIVPYAATFSHQHPDSVSLHNKFSTSDWWMACCKNNNTRSTVKTISELAKQNPDVPIIVAVSKSYLDAVQADLCTARGFLVNSSLLSIISVGSNKFGPLANNLLPCDTRMEKLLGLGRSSLNTRILGDILNNHDAEFEFKSLTSRIIGQQLNQSTTTYPVRSRMTDKEVVDFIAESLSTQSFTFTLKQLRDSGRACEYKRFKALFNRLKINERNQK